MPMNDKTSIDNKVNEAITKYGGPQEVCKVTEPILDFLEVKSKGEDFVRKDFYNNGQIDDKYYSIIAGKHRKASGYLEKIPDKIHLRITIIYQDDKCILTTFAKRGEKLFINLVSKEHVSAMYLGNDFQKAKGEYEFLVRSIHSIL